MWEDLAPNLIRQRLIIEGTTEKIVEPEQIKSYLLELARVSNMEVIKLPITSTAHETGHCGWIHWKSSGAHFYSYQTDPPLFTVDTYTCKPFSIKAVVEFTKNYFKTIKIVWKEIKV